MAHENFQEAIEKLSTDENLDPEVIKNRFNLNEEDVKAMKSDNPLIQVKTPQFTPLCCCCV